MKKITVKENGIGLLFIGGRYRRTLTAGVYFEGFGRRIEVFNDPEGEIVPESCSVRTLLADPAFASRVDEVAVGDEEIALRYVDGRFKGVVESGLHVFPKSGGENEFRKVDVSSPFVEGIPAYVFASIPSTCYVRLNVRAHEKGLVYVGGKLERILDAGTYHFWRTAESLEVRTVDMRLTQMNVCGQEILSADKVTLRISLVLTYRITDCVRITEEIADYAEQLHVACQMALREYVGKLKLDEILESKESISRHVFDSLKEKESELFVEVSEAAVKDIILPGEVRDIMNTVLVAEKKAQANVIARREEVASTRSLLNTAKMMEENPTLYRLKQLEYVERICENVGSINVGGGDLLTSLVSVLTGEK